MKTALELLKEHSERVANGKVDYNITQQGILDAMKEYAEQAITAQLIVAAEEADTDYTYSLVKKESIINCTRIELK